MTEELSRLRARVAQLEEENAFLLSALGAGAAVPTEWNLAPRPKTILACMHRTKAPFCSYARMQAALAISREPDVWVDGLIKVYIHRIRSRLRQVFPTGPVVITHFGEGYELGAQVRAAMDEYQARFLCQQ